MRIITLAKFISNPTAHVESGPVTIVTTPGEAGDVIALSIEDYERLCNGCRKKIVDNSPLT